MKCIRFTVGFLLMCSLIAVSCAKEKEQGTAITLPNYAIEKGMIHFATKGDYQQAVDMPSVPLQEAFVRAAQSADGFVSAAKALESGARSTDADLLQLIDDPYFLELLNDRLCIWIDDHIFRVNPEDGKVYVIASDKYDLKYEALLAEDAEDEDVREYPTDVNVLDEVDRPDALWPFCNQSGIPSKYNQAYFNDNTTRLASATYAKYGIYFSLFAKVSPVGSSGINFHFYFKGGVPANEGYIHYKQKCGNTVSYATRSPGTWQLTNRRFQSYQGSKGLNQVYFYFRPYKHDCPDWNGPSSGHGTPCATAFLTDTWVGFRHNY